MRGRKPTPTRLKVINGNPGKRPLNGDEPRPPEKVPSCPTHLDAPAKREWRRLVKELRPLGLLTLLDRAALAAYCVAWSRWVAAEEMISRYGSVLADKDTGQFRPNPYVAVANASLRQMHSFLTEFGLTPASRSRLHVSEAAREVDALTTFLEGAG